MPLLLGLYLLGTDVRKAEIWCRGWHVGGVNGLHEAQLSSAIVGLCYLGMGILDMLTCVGLAQTTVLAKRLMTALSSDIRHAAGMILDTRGLCSAFPS